eukprot:TRINITY_DN42000_c0_g1_i1.p1 TRINITY_DN42000_c0_g1~~TRINITY_DN42000_c0_g1_i1.p1  ORF type:complete len:240 (+),score=41.79 TRINITY_DN42000_c0_g1_i1:552-1271(+)
MSDKLLVCAHGSFGAGRCVDCRRLYAESFIKARVLRGEVARCSHCRGLVKPDIVFFGEDLPLKFKMNHERDFKDCDLILCMGTSLQVEPFAGLMARTPPSVKRIIVNRELPQAIGTPRADKDVVLLGDCNEQIMTLALALGWLPELQTLVHALYQKPSPQLADSRHCRLEEDPRPDFKSAPRVQLQAEAAGIGRALALLGVLAACAGFVVLRPPADNWSSEQIAGAVIWASLVMYIALR